MAIDESIRSWSRKGLTALSDQGLFAASTFLVNLLLARWLSAEQYGAYALAFSIYVFASNFQNAMVLEPMSVFGPASYRDSLPDYLGWLLRLHFAVTIGLGLLMGLGGALVLVFAKSTVLPLALLGVAVSIPWMLLFWLWRRAAYLGLRPNLAIRGAAVNLAAIAGLLFLFHWRGWLSPFTAFLIQGFAGLASTLVLMIPITPRLRSRWSKPAENQVLRRHWHYGRWVVLTAFVIWLGSDSYYVILASTKGIAAVAPFRALQNLLRPVYQVISAVTLLAVPWAAASLATDHFIGFRKAIDRISVLFAAAALGYLAVLTVLGTKVIQLFYAGRYVEYSGLIPLFGLPLLSIAASEGPSIALRAMEAPAEVLRSYSAASVVTVLAGIFLTRHWGIAGAATGIALSSIVFAVVMFLRYRVRVGCLAPSRSNPAQASPEREEPEEGPAVPSCNGIGIAVLKKES